MQSKAVRSIQLELPFGDAVSLSWWRPLDQETAEWLYEQLCPEYEASIRENLLYRYLNCLDFSEDAFTRALQEAPQRAKDEARKTVNYWGVPGWRTLRVLICERDQGICWLCGERFEWQYYHLGHIVDRVVGGLDTPDNLAVMCNRCNMSKTLHHTKEEAEAWRDRWRAAWETRESFMRFLQEDTDRHAA
jgi:5-methylcytosine-specific restriction endonuclease McrA